MDAPTRSLITSELATFWRRTERNITDLRQKGLLTEDATTKTGRGRGKGTISNAYSFALLDRIHRESLTNPTLESRLPSMSALSAYAASTGEHALLTTDEFRIKTALGRAKAYELAAEGEIIALKLFGLRTSGLLFVTESVDAYMKAGGIGQYVSPKGFTMTQTCDILGLSLPSVITLTRTSPPTLVRIVDKDRPRQPIVTYESVMRYLEAHLSKRGGVPCIPPHEWCASRLEQRDRLVSVTNLGERRGPHGFAIGTAIKAGDLPCLWTPNLREVRIPESYLKKWFGQSV